MANRDAAIPTLTVTDEGDEASTLRSTSTTSQSAAYRIKSQEKMEDMTPGKRADAQFTGGSSPGMQDRLLSIIFRQIFPEDASKPSKPDRKSIKSVQRPDFSLPTMSRNFRRFNARIGVVFVFQNRLMRLFSWKEPTKTLSFLAALSFGCLNLGLLAVLPLVICILFIMIPAFITRHPPPPDPPLASYEVQGPASALPPNIKPAPEMSKDFFRNMRDLQNCMEDFSIVHDRLIAAVAPLVNFADERLSSTVFLALFAASCALFLASSLIPWRLIFLFMGWALTCSTHPTVMAFLQSLDKEPIKRRAKRAQSSIKQWMAEDIALDSAPEKREVEMFELQHNVEQVWEPWLYAVSPYTPRSPLRVSGDQPRGCRYFEDVQAPKGWEWSSKKWTLDLLSREWVEERMITSVEVEVGGDRWVYDLATEADMTDAEEKAITGSNAQWRRRRWVRTVQRKTAKNAPPIKS